MELWDAYDAMENKLGHTLVRDCPIPQGEFHLVVHIWYQRDDGSILVQRRALTRPLAPGLWACTGGSAIAGESIRDALVRESREEMGIDPNLAQTSCVLSYTTIDTHTHVFIVPYEGAAENLQLQTEEVMDAKWIAPADFASFVQDKEHFWQYRYLPLLLTYLAEHAKNGSEPQPV